MTTFSACAEHRRLSIVKLCLRMTSRTWAFLTALLVGVALGASPDKPQGHRGINKPFKPGPPGVNLSKGDLDKLRKGDAVRQQLSAGSGGRGLVVQDVHAPPEVVWGRILDFPAYTRMVPRVSICENYLVREKIMEGMKEIFTRMRLTVMGFHVEYFIHHKYYPKLNTVVWTLDYDRESDLDDSVGYWHVVPHPDPDRPHWSRVYYSIDMRLKSWMPGFVKNVLKNQALTQATAWVRKESEKIGVPKHLLKKQQQQKGEPLGKAMQDKVEEFKGGWCKRVKEARDRVGEQTAKLPKVDIRGKEVQGRFAEGVKESLRLAKQTHTDPETVHDLSRNLFLGTPEGSRKYQSFTQRHVSPGIDRDMKQVIRPVGRTRRRR